LLSRGKRAAAVWFALLRRDFVLTLQINYAGGGVAREREKISSLHDLAATVTARTHFSPRKPSPFFSDACHNLYCEKAPRVQPVLTKNFTALHPISIKKSGLIIAVFYFNALIFCGSGFCLNVPSKN